MVRSELTFALDRIAQGFTIGFSASGMSSANTGLHEPENGAPAEPILSWAND